MGRGVARASVGTRPRVHLGVINHAPSDIYFPVESDMRRVLHFLYSFHFKIFIKVYKVHTKYFSTGPVTKINNPINKYKVSIHV